MLEQTAAEKPTVVEKPAEKSADKPAETASIPVENHRHQPGPREKAIAKPAAAPAAPAVAAAPVVAAPDATPPVEATVAVPRRASRRQRTGACGHRAAAGAPATVRRARRKLRASRIRLKTSYLRRRVGWIRARWLRRSRQRRLFGRFRHRSSFSTPAAGARWRWLRRSASVQPPPAGRATSRHPRGR